MDPQDFEPRKKPDEILIGQDISLLSEYELTARIAVMEAEIVRYRQAIASKQASRNAADSVFKKG